MSIVLKEILTIDGITFSILIFLYFLCKNISMNPIVGYKTRRAYKSEKHWKFAQNYAFSFLLILIPLQIITHLVMFFLIEDWDIHKTLIKGITFSNIGLVTILVIYSTENKLSKIK